jgi:hypothetical protein
VFDLKPPPPPTPPTTVTNTPPPNVRLTGITSILGNKRALFMVKQADSPGKQAKQEESYILTEGQRQGVLEVLEINEKAGTVKINNDGDISTITFDTPKPSSGPGGPGGGPPAFAGGPGAPPRLPTYSPQSGGNPSFAPRPTGAGGYGSTMQNSYGANNGIATPMGANNQLAVDNGLSSIPTRTLRTQDPGLMQMQEQAQQQPPMTLDEQMVMIEAERVRTQPMVDQGLMPPLPPTPLSSNPQGNGEQSSSHAPSGPGK